MKKQYNSMEMKSFNEISKELEGAESTNTTDKVGKLAQQLLAQGLANSLSDAQQKAKAMVETDSTVRKGFSEKKETLTNYNDPRNNPNYEKHREQVIQEMRQRARR